MKSETIIISDIKLLSKKIVLRAYTFSGKNKLPRVAILSNVRDIENRKIAEFREILGMSYAVTLDQTLTLTQTLV